ncbi:MAG: hypothetical protein ACPL4H_03640 [Anaerolineales bacterium]
MHPSSAILKSRLEFAQDLVSKLERLSADSYWAHQASGIRGSLLRWLAELEKTPYNEINESHLKELTEAAYQILIKAAKEY